MSRHTPFHPLRSELPIRAGTASPDPTHTGPPPPAQALQTMTSTTELTEQLRHIKRSLRGVMNGPVSASMREKGLTYKVNFGVEIPRLREMSEAFPHTPALASALWKEDIRECRLLASMLMPTEDFDAGLAEIWVEQMRFTEEAELTVMNLFSRCPWASGKALSWMADERRMFRLCGFLLLARLLMQEEKALSERDAYEFLDHCAAALQGSDTAVRLAAGKALTKFMDLGPRQETLGEEMLSHL